MRQEPGVALLTVSTEYLVEDPAASAVEVRLRATGSVLAARAWVPPIEAEIRTQLLMWIASPAIETVIVCGGREEARAAVQPLVTGKAGGMVSCAGTRVLIMPASLEEAVDVLVRTLGPSAAPARVERVPTDKIAVIGDLPASADVVMLDLRAGGRRGLWVFAVAVIALVGAMVGIVGRAGRQETGVVAAEEPARAASAATAVPASMRVPVAAPAPVVAADRVPAPASAPLPHVSRAASHVSRPAAAPVEKSADAPVAAPGELQLVPEDDDTCSQESCARHGNVRECCTPFRDQRAAKLERAAIARATSSIKAKVRECRHPEASDGVVRISVEVAPDGTVDQTLVVEAADAEVGRCVADVLHRLMFAATEAGGSFVYRVDLGAD